MTREKAIKEYVIPALKHTWNEKINKEVLEALEQEPIIDKIQGEIKRVVTVCHASNNHDELIRRNVVLQILDKYKADRSE